MQEQQFESNIVLIRKVQAIANRERCDVSALALAWLLRQGKDVIVIPGTTKLTNFEINYSAIELADKIDQKVIDELTQLTGSGNGFVGDRYGLGMKNFVKAKSDNNN
mmetsp:Transcript_112580/g.242590  ORF Transcript_112580/g.242590 Transcript_112580/m.242590 type:complete len:107 (+) Transcript_112580:685-1005(+)|eukprot:CAMPEP_0116919854 /NCGR_PEP_ID=MMETSP0467-20121206/20651_1 /TAXON_ID=283647 /ORGANISM="Mesodinium pulex, Strain SPMC105" /LENGTH=106 /DNA_ID=CAMNT_0004597547 /DNA_START=679 /DNA_END=999 /DNA_ORIENTATION=-